MARSSTYSNIFLFVYFIFALVEILLMSGITYGWASISFVFKQHGFFGDLCKKCNRTTNIGTNTKQNGICLAQEKRLNLVFNIAVTLLCGSKLLIGIFTDRFGPRCSQVFGGFLYISAGIGLAYTTKNNSNALFIIFSTFCVGGGFIAVAKYQVTRIVYKKCKSMVLSILHGAFDSSAAVLLAFKVIHEAGVSMKSISLFYTGLCLVLIAISTILLTPSFKDLRKITKDEDNNRVTASEPKKRHISATESIDSISFTDEQNYKDLHNRMLLIPDTLRGSICFPLYIFELIFLSVIQLKLWFYIGSLNELLQMIFIDDKKSVDYYTTLFGYFQLCGIMAGPIVGCIFDRALLKCCNSSDESEAALLDSPVRTHVVRMKESVLPFALTNGMCLVLSVLSLLKWKPGLILSFILHVVIRGFLYASHASFIGIAFKSNFFGTLYGLGIFLAGIFGLLEYFLYNATHVWLYGDPFLVNLVLLVLILLANIYIYSLIQHCKKIEEGVQRSIFMYGSSFA